MHVLTFRRISFFFLSHTVSQELCFDRALENIVLISFYSNANVVFALWVSSVKVSYVFDMLFT